MKKISHEEFAKSINSDIELLGRYVNRRTKIKVRHTCGYEWETNPYTLSRGHGCPVCKKNKKKTTESFKEEVHTLSEGDYEVLGDYINNKTPIKMKHKECGNIFYMAPKSFLKGQRCPNERYEKTRVKNTVQIKQVIEELKINRGNEYRLVGEYKGSSKKAVFQHEKCKRMFQAYPYQLIRNKTGCPYCYSSKGEDVIETYLKENKMIYKSQFRINECRNERPLPFDFAVFKENSLHVLIEYDGIQHIKPKFGIENLKKTQYHDSIKNNFCKENDINLIRIPYKRFYKHEEFVSYVIEELEKQLLLY